MSRRRYSLLLLVSFIGAGSALAQLPDPTRPADLPAAPALGAGPSTPTGSGVQTVIVRPGGKSVAVINGQQLEVGALLGDKRVVKITESEVVLKGASGREVIKLTPAIEKLPVKKVAEPKRRVKESAGSAEK